MQQHLLACLMCLFSPTAATKCPAKNMSMHQKPFLPPFSSFYSPLNCIWGQKHVNTPKTLSYHPFICFFPSTAYEAKNMSMHQRPLLPSGTKPDLTRSNLFSTRRAELNWFYKKPNMNFPFHGAIPLRISKVGKCIAFQLWTPTYFSSFGSSNLFIWSLVIGNLMEMAQQMDVLDCVVIGKLNLTVWPLNERLNFDLPPMP